MIPPDEPATPTSPRSIRPECRTCLWWDQGLPGEHISTLPDHDELGKSGVCRGVLPITGRSPSMYGRQGCALHVLNPLIPEGK